MTRGHSAYSSAELFGRHGLSRGMTDVKDMHFAALNGEQRAIDPAAAAVKKLADFPADLPALGGHLATAGKPLQR